MLELSRANFRQILSRARKDLHAFMSGHCGLVNEKAPCRCAKKTQAFIDKGYVNPRELKFGGAYLREEQEIAPKVSETLEEALAKRARDVHREQPYLEGRDHARALTAVLDNPEVRTVLRLD